MLTLVVYQRVPDAEARAQRFVRDNGLVALVPQWSGLTGQALVDVARPMLDVCTRLICLLDSDDLSCEHDLVPIIEDALALGIPLEDEYLPDPVDPPGFVRRLVGWFR